MILWDDQDHTYAYVIVMLQELFGHPPTKGFQLAHEVDLRGKAIVLTTTLEHAELKRDQIRAYGKDIILDECRGSMYATIEPALGPEDSGHSGLLNKSRIVVFLSKGSTFGHAPHRNAWLQSQPI